MILLYVGLYTEHECDRIELQYVQIFGIIESTNLRISQTLIIILYYVHTSSNIITHIFDKVSINI
jgi:hypothetical protein